MNKRISSFVISLLFIGLAALGWQQRNAVYDMWRLHDYTAPSEIAKLADDTTMNDKTRRLFYVYRPSLDDKASFNGHCSNTEQTIVLGCYIQHQGIYLYNVPDQRLRGVIQVTAAHEMLHAAYDRLSKKDKEHVDALTSKYAKTITDERLKDTIENYRKKDPSVVPNELHSILGTEVRDLPPELEQYYTRYFTDRKAIVDYADTYKQAFTEREKEVSALDARLSTLKAQIDTLNASLETQQANLKSNYEALQQQKRSGNVQGYNQSVPVYNQAVSSYNASVNRERQMVAEYNSLVEQRNNLAVEENELIKALDSRSTIESQ